MDCIKPIIIKPTNLFNSIYKNYIEKADNNESNFYILNLLKCHGYLITPLIITLNHFMDVLNQNKTEYCHNMIQNIKDKNNNIECNICLENINKKEFVSTKCLHIYCLKCYMLFHRNHLCKKQFDNLNCPICSEEYEYNHIYLVLNDSKLFKKKKKFIYTFYY